MNIHNILPNGSKGRIQTLYTKPGGGNIGELSSTDYVEQI